MARLATLAEANRSGRTAVGVGKHSSTVVRLRRSSPSLVLRMPPQFTRRDVELLLETLWGMFTQRQAERLVVSVPWDESEEPRQMVLADFAAVLESWLD